MLSIVLNWWEYFISFQRNGFHQTSSTADSTLNCFSNDNNKKKSVVTVNCYIYNEVPEPPTIIIPKWCHNVKNFVQKTNVFVQIEQGDFLFTCHIARNLLIGSSLNHAFNKWGEIYRNPKRFRFHLTICKVFYSTIKFRFEMNDTL